MLLELRHAWCHDCFPGEPVSVPVHLFEEKFFPNTQPDPSLIQLPAVPSGPVTITREERSELPLCSKSEEAVDCHEASTQSQNSIRVGWQWCDIDWKSVYSGHSLHFLLVLSLTHIHKLSANYPSLGKGANSMILQLHICFILCQLWVMQLFLKHWHAMSLFPLSCLPSQLFYFFYFCFTSVFFISFVSKSF